MQIIIVGKKSFLGKSLYLFIKIRSNFKIYLIDYKKINEKIKMLKTGDCIINCSSKRNLIPKTIDKDRDVLIIKKILSSKKKLHYVMLSSSKVYGGKQLVKKENMKLKGADKYGKHKLKIENFIKKRYNSNFTILRVSNILNFDLRKTNFSKTIINKMLLDLKFKKIITIPKKKILKDFIDVDSFCFLVLKIIKKKLMGIFNLSSGFGITLEILARNLIKGFGEGKIYQDNFVTDSFILSSSRLEKKINFNLNKKKIIKKIIFLGKQLRND